MTQLFPLGQTIATSGALQVLKNNNVLPQVLLLSHQAGDWGNLDDEDKAENTRALQAGDRILSSYNVAPDVDVWVITEWDRSATTILLPSEY